MNPIVKLKYLRIIKPYRDIATTFFLDGTKGSVFYTTSKNVDLKYNNINNFWYCEDGSIRWHLIGTIKGVSIHDIKDSLIYNIPNHD